MQTAYLASTTLFIASAIHLIIGVTILIKNKTQRINQSFFFLSFTLVLWTLFYGIAYLTKTPEQTLFWTRILTIPTFFYPVLFLYLAYIFPDNRYKRSFPFMIYHFCFIFLFVSSLFSNNYIYSARLVAAGIGFNFGIIYNILGIYIVSTMLYGCYVLFNKLFVFKGQNKSQILYVCVGALFSIMMGAIFGVALPILGIPQLNFFAPAGTIFVILLWGYAITKHELMDIKIVITRAVAYGIVGVILIASFMILNLSGLPLTVSAALNTALGLFWAFAAHRARELIQTPLEEKWITGWYNSDNLINQIATQLIPVIGKEKVFKVIAEELKAAIKIRNIEVKIGGQGVNYTDITQTKAGLIIPLSSSEGLEGVLRLGPKISEDSYNEKDQTIFRTIMVQAMAIFDRIRPYEKIEKELEAAQIKLDRSQRLASLGTLAAGVAHEIRNPLGIIHATAEELPDKPRDVAELTGFRDSIKKNTKRISSIITNMLGLAKTGEKTISKVNLNDVIESTLQLIPISGIKLIKELQPIPEIKGVVEELKQVLINLIDNAIHVMPAGGVMTIKTFREADNICLAVMDTGQGIPHDNLSKIFDPFFSTRHEGAGLGLSIVYRIVREHGADITVDSSPGLGTTFKLIFPLIPT